MKWTAFILSLGLLSSAFSQETKTPEEIQAELDEAQRLFETAQKMFIPWYTGPLITGSSNNVPPGMTNLQPYLFFTHTYAAFNDDRKSKDIPNIFTFQSTLLIQQGFPYIDVTIIPQASFSSLDEVSAVRFKDFSVTFGYQLLKQTPYRPAVRLTVGETFPTGHYRNLDPARASIDGSGAGVFSTTFGLFLNKIYWGNPLHPVSVRFAGTYAVPNHKARVKGINVYGGDLETDGRVKVGQTLNLDLGVEVALTQNWVFANDFAYTYSGRSTFSGSTTDPVGLPSSDNFSIAPAIEYNISDRGGFIGGVWFPLTGRNSANFVSIVLSFTYLF